MEDTDKTTQVEAVEVSEGESVKTKKINPFVFSSYETPSMIKARSFRDKIKRNEKCPCGSGKKYKKCCKWKEGI